MTTVSEDSIYSIGLVMRFSSQNQPNKLFRYNSVVSDELVDSSGESISSYTFSDKELLSCLTNEAHRDDIQNFIHLGFQQSTGAIINNLWSLMAEGPISILVVVPNSMAANTASVANAIRADLMRQLDNRRKHIGRAHKAGEFNSRGHTYLFNAAKKMVNGGFKKSDRRQFLSVLVDSITIADINDISKIDSIKNAIVDWVATSREDKEGTYGRKRKTKFAAYSNLAYKDLDGKVQEPMVLDSASGIWGDVSVVLDGQLSVRGRVITDELFSILQDAGVHVERYNGNHAPSGTGPSQMAIDYNEATHVISACLKGVDNTPSGKTTEMYKRAVEGGDDGKWHSVESFLDTMGVPPPSLTSRDVGAYGGSVVGSVYYPVVVLEKPTEAYSEVYTIVGAEEDIDMMGTAEGYGEEMMIDDEIADVAETTADATAAEDDVPRASMATALMQAAKGYAEHAAAEAEAGSGGGGWDEDYEDVIEDVDGGKN